MAQKRTVEEEVRKEQPHFLSRDHVPLVRWVTGLLRQVPTIDGLLDDEPTEVVG